VERCEKFPKNLVEEELSKEYFRVETLYSSIREKYDQPLVLSKILDLNVDGKEWDDSEEYANLDEFLPPYDQEKDKEPPYIEHALDENLKNHTSPRKEPKEEVYKEGQESLDDFIQENKYMIRE
jgi:hypothetical protein